MGYGDGKQAIARWREKEVEVLNEICRSHGIEPLSPEKSQSELDAFNGELKSATEKKVKIIEIDSIETKKSRFSKKISLSEEDFQNLSDLAKKQVAGVKQTKKLKSENAELLQEITDLEVQVKLKYSISVSELFHKFADFIIITQNFSPDFFCFTVRNISSFLVNHEFFNTFTISSTSSGRIATLSVCTQPFFYLVLSARFQVQQVPHDNQF
ncbi:MAG: hypothetical protein K2H28_01915 [Ruminococcus sp.]|nr:hypothetical protein [Ruminococcus sp.]